MRLNVHPAPGNRMLPAGFWMVPNNQRSMEAYGVTRARGIGDILPGCFAVPQNPITRYTSGGLGCASDCGCGGGLVNGMSGVSDDFSSMSAKLGTGDFMGALSSPILGVPAWGWVAGVAALAMFSGGGRRRR